MIIQRDAPTGYGVIPAAIMKTIVQISSMNELSAEQVMAVVTGNTAQAYGLDMGRIEKGRITDLVIIDATSDSGGNDAPSAIVQVTSLESR